MSDFWLYTEQFGLLHFDCKSYPPLSFFFFFSCIHSFEVQVEVRVCTHLPHPRLIDIS